MTFRVTAMGPKDPQFLELIACRQASSTSHCSSHTCPLPQLLCQVLPTILSVPMDSAFPTSTPTPTPARLAHSLVSFRSLLCHLLHGTLFGNPVLIAFPVFFLPCFHVSLYTFLHILFIYCLYYLSPSLQCKLHEGRSFCLFCSWLVYCLYLKPNIVWNTTYVDLMNEQ